MLGSLLNVLKGKVKVALLCLTLCDQWTIFPGILQEKYWSG